MKKDDNSDRKQVLEKMQMLCSRSEKCSRDIRLKIRNYPLKEEDEDWIISRLIEDKFIDDRRYAEYFVKDKFRLNKWGRMKIRNVLKTKNIDNSIINETLENLNNVNYNEVLKDLIRQKNVKIKDSNIFIRKGKLFRFATQRGFEPDLIYAAIDEVLKEK
jgi:regulatory protein